MEVTIKGRSNLLIGLFKTLRDGNHGSSIFGVAATAIMGANLDFNLISQGLKTTESSLETGKLVGIVLMAVWAYFIGKSPEKSEKEIAS